MDIENDYGYVNKNNDSWKEYVYRDTDREDLDKKLYGISKNNEKINEIVNKEANDCDNIDSMMKDTASEVKKISGWIERRKHKKLVEKVSKKVADINIPLLKNMDIVFLEKISNEKRLDNVLKIRIAYKLFLTSPGSFDDIVDYVEMATPIMNNNDILNMDLLLDHHDNWSVKTIMGILNIVSEKYISINSLEGFLSNNEKVKNQILEILSMLDHRIDKIDMNDLRLEMRSMEKEFCDDVLEKVISHKINTNSESINSRTLLKIIEEVKNKDIKY